MPDSSTPIFISYSRTDSVFVDRLEADLQARSVTTWVDRRKLQGGQDWQDQTQDALEHCRALLVVLSPDAVASKHARTEYRYALSLGKPVIPLLYRPCPKVPMDLNGIQWVIFQDDYDKGLQDLLVALSALPDESAPMSAAERAAAAPATHVNDSPIDLAAARPAVRAQAADLNELYRQGVRARSEGDLERAAVFWQQVLDQDQGYGGGSLAGQLRALNVEVRPLRIQRLRQWANAASRAGDWGQVAGAWRALLGIDPQDAQALQSLRVALRAQAQQASRVGAWDDEIAAREAGLELDPRDSQAQERIPIATQNRQSAWHYQNAQRFLQDGDLAAARAELETLWREAPYYGDPDGLAPATGLSAPPDYETAKAQRLQAEAASQAAKRGQRGRKSRAEGRETGAREARRKADERKAQGTSSKVEQLQLTAFHPREVRVESWYMLLVYAHIPSALNAIRDDAPRFAEETGDARHEISRIAANPVARGTQITIVPTLKGIRFNPERLSLTWTEDWQRTYFRFQAGRELAGSAGNGQIAFFAGPLLIATLRLAMLFDEPALSPSTADPDRIIGAGSTTGLYQQIFPSYSRRDKAVVVACRNAYKALGLTVNMDIDTLRSGQRFTHALMGLIESSDIFQLFWSKASADSKYVHQEWQHALKCSKGEGFIRPVYWVEPVIPPPPELADLHFTYVPLPKMQWSIFGFFR